MNLTVKTTSIMPCVCSVTSGFPYRNAPSKHLNRTSGRRIFRLWATKSRCMDIVPAVCRKAAQISPMERRAKNSRNRVIQPNAQENTISCGGQLAVAVHFLCHNVADRSVWYGEHQRDCASVAPRKPKRAASVVTIAGMATSRKVSEGARYLRLVRELLKLKPPPSDRSARGVTIFESRRWFYLRAAELEYPATQKEAPI